MGKRKRTPEVLWRLFRERARTLAETIVYLIPPECHCAGHRHFKCLHCAFHGGGEEQASMSHLLRPGDPSEYSNLLHKCYVVVPENAPPLPPDTSPINRWAQHQIVCRTIEMILTEQPASSNVICNGYQKLKDSSPVVNLLSCCSWQQLLQRVGDGFMWYLLMHTLVFLFRPTNKHQQVAGQPVSCSYIKFPRHISEPGYLSFGPSSRKRRRVDQNSCDGKKLPCHKPMQVDDLKAASKFVAYSTSNCCKVKSQLDLSAAVIMSTESVAEEGKKPSRTEMNVNLRKRPRLSSCLRHGKGKLLTLQDPYISNPLTVPGVGSTIQRYHHGDIMSLQNHQSDVVHYVGQHRENDGVPAIEDANKDAAFIPKGNGTERSLHKRDIPSGSYGCGSGNDKKIQGSIDHNICLNKAYCSNHEVVSFVWAACRNIVPPALLGSPSNWRILRRNIYRFIQLRQFEKFSLIQCLYKLKMTGFQFLSEMYSFCCISGHGKNSIIQPAGKLNEFDDFDIMTLKQNLFKRWIFWFFSHLVVPLVEANFYVTESQHGKQNLYYYRKSVWMDLSGKASSCWKDETCHALDGGSVQDILANRPFGFSKIRLCPKRIGTRVIANLKASSLKGVGQTQVTARKVSHLKSVNCILRDLLVVLKDFRKNEPEKWGSSVFDYNDVYKKLRPFLLDLKKESATPSVYIVSADVHKAFDTINQDKLLAVINETLTKDEYVLLKSSEISWSKKSLFAFENQKLMGPWNNNVGALEVGSSHPPRQRHAIIVNEVRSRTIRKEELQLLLTEHVKRNVIWINQSFFLQVVGIPQGSVLSSFLCSLYFGHLERNHIVPYLHKVRTHDILEHAHNIDATVPKASRRMSSSPKWIFLRLIDDFLLISTSKEMAAIFFSRLRRGFREYNCYMNEDKFRLNFGVDLLKSVVSGRQFVSNDGISYIQWSGLLINSCTLEIQADYTRYLDNHLSSTLTVCWHDKPGHHLKAKLCHYMRPKCYPLFYDPDLNSPSTIRLNVYQAFLLCAMKFHCYVCQLSKVCKLQARFFLLIIEKSLRYTRKLMKRRMRKMDPDSGRNLFAQLVKEEIYWLGLTAYIRALTKKQSRHKVLLLLLRSKLVALGNIGSSSELKYAVDDSHSSCLWKIKY
ncbi:hypothetical protein Dimus_024445 [Dionaea muscipula]